MTLSSGERSINPPGFVDEIFLSSTCAKAGPGLHRHGLDRDPERTVVVDHHAGTVIAATDLGQGLDKSARQRDVPCDADWRQDRRSASAVSHGLAASSPAARSWGVCFATNSSSETS